MFLSTSFSRVLTRLSRSTNNAYSYNIQAAPDASASRACLVFVQPWLNICLHVALQVDSKGIYMDSAHKLKHVSLIGIMSLIYTISSLN